MDLRAALARLDDLDREFVTLGVWQRLSSTEIDVVLTMPAAAVRSAWPAPGMAADEPRRRRCHWATL